MSTAQRNAIATTEMLSMLALNTGVFRAPDYDEIAREAAIAWKRDGRPMGREMEYWCVAEAGYHARMTGIPTHAPARRPSPHAEAPGSRPAKRGRVARQNAPAASTAQADRAGATCVVHPAPALA